MAALANANPTCLAAHTNMILCVSDKANGESVFPVPVGAVYNTIFGHFCLQIVNISFWCSYNSISAYFNKLSFFSIYSTAFSIIIFKSISS